MTTIFNYIRHIFFDLALYNEHRGLANSAYNSARFFKRDLLMTNIPAPTLPDTYFCIKAIKTGLENCKLIEQKLRLSYVSGKIV